MKYYFLAFVILLNFGCNSGEKQKKEVSFTVVNANEEAELPSVLSDKVWYELYQEKNTYVLPCHNFPERIKAAKNHLTAELTEPTDLTVSKVDVAEGGFNIYFKGNDNFYYNFKWVNQAKSIGMWTYISEGKVDSSLTFITIDQSKLKENNFKKQNCANGLTANGDTGKTPFGDWRRTCDGIPYLSVTTKGGELVVNDNQIVIKIRTESVPASPGAYNIKLFKPSDLGAGGMRLDWDSFSTDSTIAQLRLTNKPGKAIFSWFGFFNKKTVKRDWVDQSDLNLETDNNAIDVQKCN